MFNIPAHAFPVSIHVSEKDIDQMNHVNNTVYLRWVQEVAIAHWFHLTTPIQRQQWLWVIRRHEIDYLRPSFLGDEIMAYTWVMPGGNQSSDRIVVFKNEKTQKVIAQVKTTWFLVDPQTFRSTTIPNEIFELLGV